MQVKKEINLTLMEKPDNEEQEDSKSKTLKSDPTSGGRNSTDNFNDDAVDDYGIDYSKPDAEEELEYRQSVKGGRGPETGKRNRNDDFEDSETEHDDDYKA